MPVQLALTGGTGFIGTHITRALIKAGISVKSLARRPQADTARLTWIRGVLDDQPSLQRLCSGCDVLIHCAGVVRGNSLDDFLQVNLHGTERLLAAIRMQDNAMRLLLISSLAARAPHCSWYAQSKYRAEQCVAGAGLNTPPSIFRPTAVYGPGDKALQPLFTLMKHGFCPAPAGIRSRFSILHVHDLVAAVLLWLDNATVGGCYELDDGTPNGLDWDAIIQSGERAWQRRIRKVPIPLTALRTFATLNLHLARLLGYAAMLTPGKVNEITHPDWVCDNAPLTRQLGWRPQLRLADAMRDD